MINSNSKNISQSDFTISCFTDYLNIECGIAKNFPGYHFDYKIIDWYLGGLGIIKVSKVYAPWQKYQVAFEKIKHFNIELIDTQIGKDNMDVQMTVDMIDTLYKHPEIDIFAVISGDIDFLPAIQKIKQDKYNKVILISEENSLNRKYYEIVDIVVPYQSLMSIYKFL
jgi:uncharacterized protein (TIGR00288 family)